MRTEAEIRKQLEVHEEMYAQISKEQPGAATLLLQARIADLAWVLQDPEHVSTDEVTPVNNP